MFGPTWMERWPENHTGNVKEDWRRGLASYTDEALRRAYESMLSCGPDPREPGRGWDYPPTLSQFGALCRQFERRGPHSIQPALPDHRRALPPQGFQALKDVLAKAAPKQPTSVPVVDQDDQDALRALRTRLDAEAPKLVPGGKA